MPNRMTPSDRWFALTKVRSNSSARCAYPSRRNLESDTATTASTSNGTANLFVTVDANRSWRKVKVTDRRANEDFAVCMRDLVDVDYPDTDKVRVVMDNLSTHTASAIYQTFPAAEARRILRRLEFHYTPKHASWLNMAEIEIGVMRRQCLDRRIDNRDLLETEVVAWQRRRTESGAKIRWMFSTDQARDKMEKSYPTPPFKES